MRAYAKKENEEKNESEKALNFFSPNSSTQQGEKLLTFSPFLYLLPALTLFLGLIIRNGWIEPDTYAFYNRACLNGLEFSTPILSEFIFSLIPCQIYSWFFFQASIFLLSLILLGYALKNFLKINELYIFLFGLSIYALNFFMGFEDDHLAFGLIFFISWYYLANPSPKKLFLLLLSGAILSFTIWKGAIIPLVLVAGASFSYLFGIIILLVLIFTLTISIRGVATEEMIGRGFFINIILYLIMYYFRDFKNEFVTYRKWVGVSGVLLLAAYFQPKWGVYSLIGLIPLFYHLFKSKKVLLTRYATLGLIILMVMPVFLLWYSAPRDSHWRIIETAIIYQRAGALVLNEWGVGRYFQFKGGVPSAAGGYSGEPVSEVGFYWLGPERKGCFTLMSDDWLFFQECPPT